MSNRPEITMMLSISTEMYINPHGDPRIYWAKEVTFDYATSNAVRVDYMKFKPVNNTVSGIEKGDFYCYEVKSSVEDFHSKNGHNFIGDFNYYVMPEDVYEKVKDEIAVPGGQALSGESRNRSACGAGERNRHDYRIECHVCRYAVQDRKPWKRSSCKSQCCS